MRLELRAVRVLALVSASQWGRLLQARLAVSVRSRYRESTLVLTGFQFWLVRQRYLPVHRWRLMGLPTERFRFELVRLTGCRWLLSPLLLTLRLMKGQRSPASLLRVLPRLLQEFLLLVRHLPRKAVILLLKKAQQLVGGLSLLY